MNKLLLILSLAVLACGQTTLPLSPTAPARMVESTKAPTAKIDLPTVEVLQAVVIVSADKLKIRETPSTSADVLGVALNGAEFETLHFDKGDSTRCSGWYMIKYQNGKAWICADYVRVK